MNEPEYLKAARHLAQKTLSKSQLSDQQRLNVIYETITSHLPDKDESEILLSLVDEMKAKYKQNPQDAQDLCDGLNLNEPKHINELATWTMLVNSLYNLDITKTRE